MKLFRQKKGRLISRAYITNSLLMVSIAIGAMGTYWLIREWSDFSENAERIKEEYFHEQKQILKSQVDNTLNYINIAAQSVEGRMKNELKSRVYEAWSIANSLYQTNKGKRSDDEIKEMIKQALRPVRFLNGRGYFFATSLKGVEILHPVFPEFEGKNIIDLQDGHGNYVIRDEIDIVSTKGEGFIVDYWPKPDGNQDSLYPKTSFVKLFEPFNWYIGTGEYMDNIEADVQEEVIERISSTKFGEEGYIFVDTYDGYAVIIDSDKLKRGAYVWDVTDPNGVKVIQEEYKIVNTPDGGGFIEYSWKKRNSDEIAPKISYIAGYPKWEWMIGAGVYVDDIQKLVENERLDLMNKTLIQIMEIIFILFLTWIGVYLLLHRTTTLMRKNFSNLIHSFQNAILAGKPTEERDYLFSEYNTMAGSFNQVISERSEAQKALELQKVRFEQLFLHNPDGIALTDSDGIIHKVNQAFTDIFGYGEDAVGKNLKLLLVSEDFKAESLVYFKEAVKGKSIQNETIRRHKGGQLIEVSIVSAPIRINNETIGIYWVYRDIRERKKAEQLLREEEKRWRDLFNNLPGGSFAYNKDYDIVDANDALSELTNYSKAELLGMKAVQITNLSKEELIWADSLNQGKNNIESVLKNRDGNEFPIVKSLLKVNLIDHDIIICNFQDITSLKIYEEQLKFARDQATEADKLKTVFLANMSHEIRTPMNAILGFSELLRDDELDKESRDQSLDIITKNGQSLMKLIDDIIDVAKIEAGQVKLIKSEEELGEILDDVYATCRQDFDRRNKKHIELRLQIPPHLKKLHFETDRYRLRQVLINLLTNAVKFTDKGFIEIRIEEQKTNELTFHVTDTGTGIPAEKLEMIFTRFRQVEETLGRNTGGAGLGLTISKSIVELLGGRIWAESEMGKGSCFSFTHPHNGFIPLQDKQTQTQKPKEGPVIFEGKKILIVEDVMSNFVFLKTALRKNKVEVQHAVSGIEAVEAVRKEHFDLILMDIQLPEMDGYTATREILKIKPEIPVVAQTAYAMSGQAQKCKDAGCVDYLAKPIRTEQLVKVLQKYLG